MGGCPSCLGAGGHGLALHGETHHLSAAYPLPARKLRRCRSAKAHPQAADIRNAARSALHGGDRQWSRRAYTTAGEWLGKRNNRIGYIIPRDAADEFAALQLRVLLLLARSGR